MTSQTRRVPQALAGHGWVFIALLTLFMLVTLCAGPLAGQARPSGVTDSLVAAGREIYAGHGQCTRCHGENAEGTEEAVTLRSGQWELGTGDYDWLISVIRHSGIAARGRDGDPLPMRGPTLLSEAEVKAVAAYVWSISRGRRGKAAE